MIIEKKSPVKLIRFDELVVGTVFEHQDNIYLKVVPVMLGKITINALRFFDNNLVAMSNVEVQQVDYQFIVEF